MKILFSFIAAIFLLSACDWNGPWSFYPEERKIYRGIYTYAYVIEGEEPRACFSKMYELGETAAENFPFYDSAKVFISGNFLTEENSQEENPEAEDSGFELAAEARAPNCFSSPKKIVGRAGESYFLSATFVWDSSGHTVKSQFSGTATIPQNFGIQSVSVPLSLKKSIVKNFTRDTIEAAYLEFPEDLASYKIALNFDHSVGGAFVLMKYDLKNGGENQNTTFHQLFGGLLEKDSLGYLGASLHNALENTSNLGFTRNQKIGKINLLDSIVITNMSFPIGNIELHFYGTDWNYSTYEEKVIRSARDARITAESNIQNGMGVFSGMRHEILPLKITGEKIPYEHIKAANCKSESDDESFSHSKACRLFQDVFCAGLKNYDDLISANESASEFYAENLYRKEDPTCYPSLVKAAMMLDSSKWSAFLPKNIDEGKKSEAYADGLKRYCVANNFQKSASAQCDALEKECNRDKEKNKCKEYIWEWCADRNWDFDSYPQCGTAFVSRARLENAQSPIVDKVVASWCSAHAKDFQCQML